MSETEQRYFSIAIDGAGAFLIRDASLLALLATLSGGQCDPLSLLVLTVVNLETGEPEDCAIDPGRIIGIFPSKAPEFRLPGPARSEIKELIGRLEEQEAAPGDDEPAEGTADG